MAQYVSLYGIITSCGAIDPKNWGLYYFDM